MNTSTNSQALIIARESRGKSQQEVADATGITQGAISKAENDLFVLGVEQVEKVARYLDFPSSFFYEAGPLRDGVSMCHYHRKRKTLPAKVLNRVNASMFVRVVNVRHLMNGLEIIGPRTFHSMDLEEFGTPQAVAQALRKAWGIPEGPVIDLTALLESAGAIVVLGRFEHRKLFGMSCWPTRDAPLFYLNSEIPSADLRWTMAHELGHLTMHRTPSAGDIEKEADEFAAEFLMPAHSISPNLKSVTFQQLGPLKLYWRVSIKTLIYQAKSLGCISDEAATRLYKQYSARHFNTAEPYDIPPEKPTILTRAAEVHLKEHGYSPMELRESLRITNAEDYYEVTGLSMGRGKLSLVDS